LNKYIISTSELFKIQKVMRSHINYDLVNIQIRFFFFLSLIITVYP